MRVGVRVRVRVGVRVRVSATLAHTGRGEREYAERGTTSYTASTPHTSSPPPSLATHVLAYLGEATATTVCAQPPMLG